MKRIFLLTFAIILLIAFTFISIFLIKFLRYDKVKFDIDKINDTSLSISLYDNNNLLIREGNIFNSSHIKIDTLPSYVSESFISIEDKSFYRHHGVNYKRMAKAFINNLKSGKIKEGASTISQQLIKNTHLSSDKTYTRKLNEILITFELEKNFTKKEILESYLNAIYFGNGCYGIEDASKYYFSKSAKELKLNEAATLAGIIKSPSYYSPITQNERCKNRRDIVLREMYKDKKISYETMCNNVNSPLNISVGKISNDRLNSYSQAALTEAMKLMNLPAKNIAINGYKIYTYLNKDKQIKLKEAIENNLPQSDFSAISINNKDCSIECFVGKANLNVFDVKRQPGSAIKPILVYAPALEECIISPETQILDEAININGYSPKNIYGIYEGYVSVEHSINKSLNIPAVKVLSYLGIDNAKMYASKLGIEFDNNDTGYSLALGGMTHGTTLQELTNSYLVFANDGYYKKASFINYITDKNDKIIYRNNQNSNRVFRDDTAYLTNSMLISSVKNGTSKGLKDLDYEVASKTGTVGGNSEKLNNDAWSVSYTFEDTVGIWLGNLDNTPIEYAGGGLPIKITKNYMDSIYKERKPANFSIPSSVEEIDIDTLELEKNHKLVRANDYTPERFKIKKLFSKFNLPKESSQNFISISPTIIKGKVDKLGNAIITFNAEDYLTYQLYKVMNNKKYLVEEITNKKDVVEIQDYILPDTITNYYVITKLTNYATNKELISDKSNIIELININNTSIINNNSVDKKEKWYI